MKKIGWLSMLALCLPFVAMAQSYDDDLYYVPKKNKDSQEKKVEVRAVETTPTKRVTTTEAYIAPDASNVVFKDVKGNKSTLNELDDVDAYNRRYTSRDNYFYVEDDTLVVEEKPYDERGEWVDGFDGSDDDYEYAMRIIRFRNPRYAIPISSPFYWDVVYGVHSWQWNVYEDGLYAYMFPTYSNPYWWNWRFNSFGWGYGGWYNPYNHYGWGGYYGGYWGNHWGHHHHHHGYWGGNHWGGGGWAHHRPSYYNDRRPTYAGGESNRRPSVSTENRRPGTSSGSRPVSATTRPGAVRPGGTTTTRPSGTASSTARPSSRPSTGRTVVGTRPSSGNSSTTSVRPTSRPESGTSSSVGSRPSGNSSTRQSATRPSSGSSSNYTRPSSTRQSSSSSSSGSSRSSSSSSSSSRSSSYSRSSSSSSSSSSRSSSSYSSGSSSRSSSSGSYSSGGSSRGSSGGGGGSRSSGGRR